jgi:hypothetical protein
MTKEVSLGSQFHIISAEASTRKTTSLSKI